MALVLRFDENHDFIDTIMAKVASECGDCLAVCFTVHGENINFNKGLLIRDKRIIHTFSESSLPNKVKTFLLLGGLDYAITSTNNT